MILSEINKDQVLSWAQSVQMNINYGFDENKNPIIVVPTPYGNQICTYGDSLNIKDAPEGWWKLEVIKVK